MTARPLLVGAVFALALVGALLFAGIVMEAPRADVEALARLLSISSAGSLLAGTAVVHWGGGRLRSLRLRLLLAYTAGLVVVCVTVAATSILMFLSSHDLSLVLLVLAFAGVVAIAFGDSVADALTRDLRSLAHAAQRVAGGDWRVRVNPRGTDEVARLAQTFDQMVNQLEGTFRRERETEASRRNLMAAVSHDLRTPLATTRAMVEAILDGVVTDPSEVQRYLELIRGEVHHLGRLIDDLFELTQIEVGALELRLTPTPLTELLSETLEAYEADAHDRGLVLEKEIEPDLPPVSADPPRLQRVLRNLLDNAQRYSPPGSAVRVEARGEGVVARISVSDQGPGLAPEELELVFERFYRGQPARSRQSASPGGSGGGGLGLAIARGLVEGHGGRIWAEARKAGGTAFHFTVPFSSR